MKEPTARKLRPAVKTHGGKSYNARNVIATFPPHRTYVEPFAGGLNVLLNKPRSAREVAGDLDAELIGFYRVLVERAAELIAAAPKAGPRPATPLRAPAPKAPPPADDSDWLRRINEHRRKAGLRPL